MDATTAIRDALESHGGLTAAVTTLSDDDDLYQAGLTSHASVNVMLAVENAFDIEFPDAALTKATFQSVASIRDAVDALRDDSSSPSA
jgi:acyl carrier protein